MPFPYYNNYYNPYQQPILQNQPYQQTNYQPIQQTYQQNPSSIIWVHSLTEAQNYPLAPNNAIALWDTNSATVYLKQADASGKPTMKTYDLVERLDAHADGANNEAGKNIPYATKEDVAALAGVVKGFDGAIETIKGEIEEMSGYLYGIAGKKKAKKAESEDE